jgi:hypothetical protein
MRTYKISYTPAAIAHIIQITKWYNEQQKGLGRRFKDHLKTALGEIKKNPFSCSCRYSNVRFAVVKKFPYAAHYTINEYKHSIIIHAIFGFSEDPGKWSRISSL